MRLLRILLFLPLTLSLSLLSLPPAFGWGDAIHRIIAQAAEERLTPAAYRSVHALLPLATPRWEKTPENLADIATYADWLRYHAGSSADSGDKNKTRGWHYVDIPDDSNVYLPARDCPADETKGACILAALPQQEAILRNSAASQAERAEALMFIVHLLGDLHQPLHCDNKQHDAGGNARHVYMPRAHSRNLHALWDYGLMNRYYDDKGWENEDERPYLAELNAYMHGMSEKDIRAIQTGDYTTWALESHQVARDHAYHLPDPIPNPVPDPGNAFTEPAKMDSMKTRPEIMLGDAYFNENKPVMDLQIARAVIRLSALLNQWFAEK